MSQLCLNGPIWCLFSELYFLPQTPVELIRKIYYPQTSLDPPEIFSPLFTAYCSKKKKNVAAARQQLNIIKFLAAVRGVSAISP